MISGLWNGVTGLNSFQKALATQSNNVTNSNTIAHKKDDISFEDLMYQSRYGKGVQVQSVEKNFSQGDLKETNNTLDAAIEGDGFFVVNHQIVKYDDAGEAYVYADEKLYTRAGNFKMGTDGILETIDSKEVYGSRPTITTVSSDDTTQFTSNYTKSIATEPIFTLNSTLTINAKSTNYVQSATSDLETGAVESGNGAKTSSGKISDIENLITDYNEKLDLYAASPNAQNVSSVSQVNQIYFQDFQTQLVNDTSIEVFIDGNSIRQNFDTDASTTMKLFADKISNYEGLTGTVDNAGTLTITSLVPGKDHRITTPSINDRGYGVNETVAPVLGSGIAMVNSSRDALQAALTSAGAQFLEITNTLSAAGSASLDNIGQIQLKLDSLGISENTFGELSIEDGLIYAKENDNKFLIGRLDTFAFHNPDSLEPQGGTFYKEGKDTATAINAHNLNNVVGGSLELSNTDFSKELVDLMVYQRAFEASSKSITTADEFLRTAIELKN